MDRTELYRAHKVAKADGLLDIGVLERKPQGTVGDPLYLAGISV